MLDLGGVASALGGAGGDAGPDADAAGAGGDAGSSSVAGAPSGGTGGAATAGSGGNAGSGGSGCTSAGTELCDNFESGVIDKALWQVPKPSTGVTVAVDNSRPHASRRYSLHIHVPAGEHNYGILTEAVTFPARSNSFYTRIFTYLYPALPQMQGSNYQIGFIYGTGENDVGNVQTGMGVIGGSNQIVGYSIFFGPPFYQFGPWSPTRMTPGTWICLELHEDGSHTDTEDRQVWINDQELTELRSDSKTIAGTSSTNYASPAYTLINIGLSEFTSTPLLTDMWVDDVRVSSQKIGCKY